ncbi:MAG: hypothetical protein NC341_08245 [Blautia sp.]|nr:hypothetical protein [Blautia sp.]MCM1201382.1 hypothetical protein [Bacteroides fragilis]
MINNLKNGVEALTNDERLKGHANCTLICGAMMGFDKGLSRFLNKMYEYDKTLFFLSEVTAEKRRYTDEVCDIPHICTPHLLAKEMIVYGIEIPISKEADRLINQKKYLQEAERNMQLRHINLGDGYARMWVYYAYHYFMKLLDILLPKKVILWNEFYAFHSILRGICQEKFIRLRYMEFGCIPGTICMEKKGQQGESLTARRWLQFYLKQVTAEEIKEAEKVLSYLYETGLNRNVQPQRKMKNILLLHYSSNRKTILYLGQNDYESGLQPYTRTSRRYHSPRFKTSIDALEYLNLLCIKNNYNLIFKPHPIMVSLGQNILDESENYDFVNEVDINSVIDFSDLIVTILSQGAYIGLIRKKPVLMLGYTQLKGKKCTYEAFKKADIEFQIKRALSNGFTDYQYMQFKKHTAQLLKYYLYDDGNDRIRRYGKIL